MKNISRLLWAILLMAPLTLLAQKEIVIETSDLTIDVGEKKQLSAYVTDGGKKLDDEVVFRSRSRKALFVDSLGVAHAYLPGTANVIAFAAGVRKNFEMMVNFPPIAEIKIDAIPDKIYAGTPVRITYEVIDKAGLTRQGAIVAMKSNNEIKEIDEIEELEEITQIIEIDGIN